MNIRNAEIADYETIRDLCIRNGLRFDLSVDQWRNFWFRNPASNEIGAEYPIGWILENSSGCPIGTFSNIITRFRFSNETLTCATGSMWAVDRIYRSSSILLAQKYFSQSNVDFCLTTTPNKATDAVFRALKCKEVAPEGKVRSFFWILQSSRVIEFLANKKRGYLLRHAGVALPCRLGMTLVDSIVRHRLPTGSGEFKIASLNQFPAEIDMFWKQKVNQTPGITTCRTASVLNWALLSSRAPDQVTIVVSMSDDRERINGYIALVLSTDSGLRRLRIVDFQTLKRFDRKVAKQLLASVLRQAKTKNVDVVEGSNLGVLQGQLLSSVTPFFRNVYKPPYLVKGLSPRMKNLLDNTSLTWDLSTFDGDTSLF